MQLIVISGQQRHILHGELGDNLLTVLQADRAALHAPCGGRGTCRKCRVEIDGLGEVLACQTLLTAELMARVTQPLTVKLPAEATARISTDGLVPDLALNPLIVKGTIQLTKPSLDDQRPDDERFSGTTGLNVPFRLLSQLPAVLQATDFAPSFYFRVPTDDGPGEVLRFCDEKSSEPLGIAVDIGTTTLAAYLIDLCNGERLAAASALNPQRAYGADVISRIDQAATSSAMPKRLQLLILEAIGELAVNLIQRAAAKHGRAIALDDVCHYVLAGNTTMLHLLTGLPTASIAQAPFVAASLRSLTLTAAELGLPVAPDACCQLLPAIASFVGADITAGIMACNLDQPSEFMGRLLLDMGTNGEIVAVGPNGLFACATAAGPAFEAANIRCGIGAVQGAIDEVIWTGEDLTFTVIADDGIVQSARGICGSGLVAAAASLLECGLMDETGRLGDGAAKLPEALQERLIKIDGQPAVVIAAASSSATGQPIVLTQKDIRELQNAKAAIAAGILLILDRAGLEPGQVGQALIAGGFGNYLDVVHAFRIGLLPPALAGKTKAVGNTSGMGAMLGMLDRDTLKRATDIAGRVNYFELSSDSRFADHYVEAMLFPEAES